MDWFGQDDIQSKLKDLPKFKMSETTVQRIKSHITNMSVKSKTNCKLQLP